MPKEASWPPPQETASYIIFKDGTLTKAKNGQTGHIQFSNADSATVIQAALDRLESVVGAGKIHIKACSSPYSVTSTLRVPPRIILEGESPGTSGAPQTVLQVDGGAINVIENRLAAFWNEWNLIRNLRINHNGTGRCIHFDGLQELKLEDCWLNGNVTENYLVYINTHGCAKITGNRFRGGGIELTASGGDSFIAFNDFYGGPGYGIYLPQTVNVSIIANTINSMTNSLIFSDLAFWLRIVGNQLGGGVQGIHLSNHTLGSVIADNSITGCGQNGIMIQSTSEGVSITGNSIDTCNDVGILITTSEKISIVGNNIRNNSKDTVLTYPGIYMAGHKCVVVGNVISDDQGVITQLDGIWVEGNNNLVMGNQCTRNSRYGILVMAGATSNKVIKNYLYLNGTKPYYESATAVNTQIDGLTVPFVDGTDPQDGGFLINAAGEMARAYAWLPLEVQQVMRMKVHARAGVLEADKMLSDFSVYGAADNEPYNTHDGSVASLQSISANFAQDDVIYWTLTPAGVLALLGGDSVQVKALHRIAGGADSETNAYFRTVSIEYV